MADMQRHVLVTGASSGIGRACVARLVSEGVHVLANVRKPADAEALSAAFGAQATPLVFDVSDEATIAAAAAHAKSVIGGARLFGLVNNAGIAVPGPLLHVSTEDLARQMDVNLLGVHRVTRAFAPLLGAGGDAPAGGRPGRIVMMSSVGGLIAAPFNGPYNCSKFALEAYARVLRKELMLYGVDVIVIGPGAVATPIWEKAEAQAFDKFRDTPYWPALERVRAHMLKIGRSGLAPEAIANTMWTALSAPSPRPRYSAMRRPFVDGVLPRLLPTRLIDRITARFLGFAPRS